MGIDTDKLRSAVAEFYGADASAITPDFKLTTPERQGSIARYALDAALSRAMGVRSRSVYTVATYGELESALTGEAVAPSPRATVNVGGDVACGIDLESVESMPEADDYFAHEFYSAHFTSAEIAYCTSQESPRMHFAARWCAKEALKKCDGGLLSADMATIEVALDESGAAHLRHATGEGEPTRLPYALSMTHTSEYAAASVMRAPAPVAAPNVTPPNVQPETRQPLLLHIVAIVLALLALGVAALGFFF